MKINTNTKFVLILIGLISSTTVSISQIRTSAAEYLNTVQFSGSQSSTTGIIYEVMPGPSVINPAMSPTPFSDSIQMTTGNYNLFIDDNDTSDSPSSQDSVRSVNIQFTGDNGQKYKIDNIMIIHKPDGAGDHPFFGGIGLNKMMHGNTGIGTNLMPKMMAYITLWGITDLKDATNDTIIAAGRIIHLMVATNVRDANLKMDTNVVTDGSDYNIKNAHTHIILPPLDMAGNMSPVPGTAHGFLHMMFEKPILNQADKDWTKVFEVLPGPAAMNLAMSPTPFSDNVSIGSGAYSLSLIDLDSNDSPTSKDSVISVNIQYQRPNGDKFLIDHINIIHKPDGSGDHPFFGGIGYDVLMHGNTTIGTDLMPKMKSYITLWGLTDLKDMNGNVIASNRIIHLMVATRVRRADLTMIASGIIDSSDYDQTMRETHIILPPLDMAGNMSPVPGTGHGFLHLMFENVDLQDSTIITSINEVVVKNTSVKSYPNPFKDNMTIEYQLSQKSKVKVTIYDLTGSIIEVLINEVQLNGLQQVVYTPNENLPSGIYFYEIATPNNRIVGRLSLIK
tara:strand:- start:49050 stop:50735 length:1686 start_codon:yes stop_codon:yes gene_type:complete